MSAWTRYTRGGSSVFLDTNHLFLRNPRGGVENAAAMRDAGFGAIFCNVKDHLPEEWAIVRANAEAAGVVCGPWARTTETDIFEPALLDDLLAIADAWHSPLIVNSEAELKGSGSELTSYIAERCGDRDWALSMEPWPFADVDWTPIAVPVLPQIFGPSWGADSDEVRAEWQRCGVRCVVHTFGTYEDWTPSLYDLVAPFGLYTADDCGGSYARWGPLGSREPCAEGAPPPTEGGQMEEIGSQHGISALANVFREQWPDKTGKPDPDDPTTWKAIDKWERAMLILVEDHDAQAKGGP